MEQFVGAPLEPLPSPSRPADGALVTHLHGDHADPAALARALTPEAVVYRPAAGVGEFLDVAATLGAEKAFKEHALRTEELAPWEERTVGPFTVTAVPAVDGFGDPQISWVVEADGVRILHAGDTVFHGYWWRIAMRVGAIDLAFLPINGPVCEFPHRQPPSPLPAALDPRQAAVAAHLLGARGAVPMHYGAIHNPPVYAQVDDPAAGFVREAEGLGVQVQVVAPGDAVAAQRGLRLRGTRPCGQGRGPPLTPRRAERRESDGDEQHHARDEQQRDDALDLRRGARGRLGAGAPSIARDGGQRLGRRPAEALGAVQHAREGTHAVRGARAAAGFPAPRRAGRRATLGRGAAGLCREHPGWPTSATARTGGRLASMATRRRSSTSGSSTAIVVVRRRVRTSCQASNAKMPAAAPAGGQHEPEAAGRRSGEREGEQRAGQRGAGLDRHRVRDRDRRARGVKARAGRAGTARPACPAPRCAAADLRDGAVRRAARRHGLTPRQAAPGSPVRTTRLSVAGQKPGLGATSRQNATVAGLIPTSPPRSLSSTGPGPSWLTAL